MTGPPSGPARPPVADQLSVEALPADRAAADAEAALVGGPPVPLPVVRDVDADGVPCRLYDPRNGHGAPVVLVLHGGGWVSNSVVTHDGLCRRLAHRSGCAVLSVGYRLAPEHPWPAAVDDAETALRWVRRQARTLGVDGSRTALVGDSSGGNLAAVLARRARDAGEPVDLQVLVYPVIAPPTTAMPEAEPGELSARDMDFYWDCYVPDPADRAHPDAVPARAASLTGLPPALVLTAERDVLRPEGEAYADALRAAGVEVVCIRYRGVPHGFFRRLTEYLEAPAAVDQVAAAVADALDPPTPRPH